MLRWWRATLVHIFKRLLGRAYCGFSATFFHRVNDRRRSRFSFSRRAATSNCCISRYRGVLIVYLFAWLIFPLTTWSNEVISCLMRAVRMCNFDLRTVRYDFDHERCRIRILRLWHLPTRGWGLLLVILMARIYFDQWATQVPHRPADPALWPGYINSFLHLIVYLCILCNTSTLVPSGWGNGDVTYHQYTHRAERKPRVNHIAKFVQALVLQRSATSVKYFQQDFCVIRNTKMLQKIFLGHCRT